MKSFRPTGQPFTQLTHRSQTRWRRNGKQSMYDLRVHTLDERNRPAGLTVGEASPSTSNATTSPTPPSAHGSGRNLHVKVLEITGVVHLYRNSSCISSSSTSTSTSTSSVSQNINQDLPLYRGTLLFVVAVPSSLSIEDFLQFCGDLDTSHFLEVRVIRNEGIEDRYSLLILLNDQKSADNFFLNLNGWKYPSAEQEVCHILFVASVEYTESIQIASTPPAGSIELPTCPVCLERLDQDTSGIARTDCDHSFRCSCVSKWENSSCPVCRFCQQHSDKPKCSVCETTENLWICIICSFIGCGRYKEGHAIKHWKDSQHCHSLDLETKQVWDYVGDTYVHRLNVSKSDEKMVKQKHDCTSVDGNCGLCECSETPGIDGLLFGGKVEAIVEEYNRLLAKQIEDQKEYHESLIVEAKAKKEKLVAEATKKALTKKMQDIQLEIEKINEEKNRFSKMNEQLRKDQHVWQEQLKKIEEREKSTLSLKNEKILNLQEEVRDFKVFLEAQKAVEGAVDADDIKEGTILPLPPQQTSPPPGNRKSSRTSRRRR